MQCEYEQAQQHYGYDLQLLHFIISSSLTTIISDISNYKTVLSVKVTDGLVEIVKLVFVLLIYS